MTPAAVFDRMAAGYDAAWTNAATGRAQRNQVWLTVDELFAPGDRILDVGCGTGEDAAHFAARGMAVHAADASTAMVQAAAARGGFSVEVCAAEEIARVGKTFDGAISNFGALNCVRDLPGVSHSLSTLVRPGGVVAICLLGRVCAWETLYYLAHLHFTKAFRRWRGIGAFRELTVYYPTASQVGAAFGDDFELLTWRGIGVCVPPSYIKLPAAMVRWLAVVDRIAGRLPLLRGLADHRLFLLVRK